MTWAIVGQSLAWAAGVTVFGLALGAAVFAMLVPSDDA